VRALDFKWVLIIFRFWQARTTYDEVKYLESLRRKGHHSDLCGQQPSLSGKFFLTSRPQMGCSAALAT
jgi:hypothetical protein